MGNVVETTKDSVITETLSLLQIKCNRNLSFCFRMSATKRPVGHIEEEKMNMSKIKGKSQLKKGKNVILDI